MSKRDVSHTLSEVDFSDEFSLETSVPTDISLSHDDTGGGGSKSRMKKVSKQLLERKQLLHDKQLGQIELSQSRMMLDNLKAEHMQKIEELEEQYNDVKHQKDILQARLESQLTIQQEDSKGRQQQIQHELDKILQRMQEMEATNVRLQQRAVDIRDSLDNLELTEDQYRDARNRDADELALKDFVAMKLYETLKPWKLENTDLKTRNKSLSDDLHRVKSKLEKTEEALQEEKMKAEDLHNKHQKLSLTHAGVKSQVQCGDFKIQNYDRVKQDRDSFEADLSDLRKKHAYIEASLQTVERERDDLCSQLASNKQTIELLQKDKDFFSKQVSDTHNKLLYAEEKVIQLNEQSERAKQSREELYEKYVASRDQYKMEYEAKLREELEQIRVRTNTEIDRLKTSSREMYERENRNLREARDMAFAEKDRSAASEKDTLGKYEQLMQDFRHQQITGDNKHSDLHNEVKLKSFESERIQMVYEETVRTLKECQLENEKLQKKLEVMTKEYYSIQATLDRRTTELESAIGEKNVRLETYEKLERELDDVVMQAADVEEEDEAERVLFSYGYGANVPTTAKRRLKQSVHLARRVLQLERANVSMRKEIEREQVKCRQLADEVKSANTLLDQSQQPYHYLVESIRVRDGQLAKQRDQLVVMEEDIARLEKERVGMAKVKNQMAEDLEKLLLHKEEMSVMKQVVMNLSHRRNTEPPEKGPRVPKSPKAQTKKRSTVVHQPPAVMFEGLPAEEVNMDRRPAPTEFTVQHPPDWFKRVQAKGKMQKSKYSTVQNQ